MARNSEKAQSMLYRFREQQAAEMGMGNRRAGDRRPRIAASVSSLRDCERWRGDVLKEISRKVSKIQDDYEIRDLNDEINSLMREKRHWETQIVALGGANYKRAQSSMTDDAGREVPGTRGYKYFGRAKDLPGVKELFARGSANASEESARNASFQMFRNQGPEYFGDMDELDAELAAAEEAAAREAWAEAVAETAKILSIDEADIPYPVVPISAAPTTATTTLSTTTASAPISAPTGPAADRTNDDAAAAAAGKSQPQPSKRGQAKRKAGAASDANGGAEADGKTDINGNGDSAEGANGNGNAESAHGAADEDTSKKARTDAEPANGTINGQSVAAAATSAHQAQVQAQQQAFAASFGGLFDPASLAAPVLPTQAEMGDILLEVRKRALREEYGV